MALFENFPYTNLHELNLDWLINELNRIKESAVISVNGMTGDVVLYEDATVQFPNVSEDHWSVIRMANGTNRGIMFGNDNKAYIVHGNLMAELFTQNSTAKFNKQNFIAGIAFANELGHGIVLKDWENNAEEKETFEKQVVADNHYRKSIKTIMIDEDLAIHNVFTVEFFVGEGVYAPDISTQSVLINKKITSVATPSDPEHREREFIGWATKSDATINEVVDVDEYEIVEDTAFYAVFEYFEEHIHKICGYASGDFCFHEGLATHSGDIEYMPLTLRYVQNNSFYLSRSVTIN